MAPGLERFVVDRHAVASLAVRRASGATDSLEVIAERIVALAWASGIILPGRAEAPELVAVATHDLPPAGTRVVRLAQRHRGVPVHGAVVGVEVREGRVVQAEGHVADPGDLDITPVLDGDAARRRAACILSADHDALREARAELVVRFDRARARWVLAWVVTPSAPPGDRACRVFIDATSGAELVRVPLAQRCAVVATHVDRAGRIVPVDVLEVAPGRFELTDVRRNICTRSLGDAPYDRIPSPLPGVSVTSDAPVFDDRAAVAAHRHAAVVCDFLRDVLGRAGVDDRGARVTNVVSCRMTDGPLGAALWFRDTDAATPEARDGMVLYGALEHATGARSFAEAIEVVGHELTHGVIQHTADLEYAHEPGALNESYANIFGAMIARWSSGEPSGWSWQFGASVSADGRPMHDMSDPGAWLLPGHMTQRMMLFPGEPASADNDYGHVHLNSSIHDLAACHVMRSGRFTREDCARLFYLTLATPGRLPPTASFADSRDALITTCGALFPSDRARVGAIEDAFAAVGL